MKNRVCSTLGIEYHKFVVKFASGFGGIYYGSPNGELRVVHLNGFLDIPFAESLAATGYSQYLIGCNRCRFDLNEYRTDLGCVCGLLGTFAGVYTMGECRAEECIVGRNAKYLKYSILEGVEITL